LVLGLEPVPKIRLGSELGFTNWTGTSASNPPNWVPTPTLVGFFLGWTGAHLLVPLVARQVPFMM